MTQEEHIRRQLDLGEDSRWEFQQIEFSGNKPVRPSRNDLADEMGAFANKAGGNLLLGVADDGAIQGMSREQMTALGHMLAEVSTQTLDPPLRIEVHNKKLEDKALILVTVPRGEALHHRGGQAFVTIRVGATKQRLGCDESLRLAQDRAQIEDAVQFVVRNMRVAARKIPERVDIPQYSKAAVFEAVVNAVAHRDYSMKSRKIRLSMFKDRLELDSPGRLPNGMTIEGMETSQATRNEVITSVFGRIPVTDVAGSDHRRHLMERRGDGVSIIRKRTEEATGLPPNYKVIDESELVLRIPAAKPELIPADATVTVYSSGVPLAGIKVLALFPNKTWVKSITDETGEAALHLYTSNLPMRIYAAGPGYAAGLERAWQPNQGGLLLPLEPLKSGGAEIFEQSTGRLPGLQGRLNPIRDSSDRTYLYADNITIDEGRQQPVPFRLGKPLRLTDAHGAELSVVIVDIIGQSALVEYQLFKP